MPSDPAAVRLRITAPQMSVIWPGLDRIVLFYIEYRKSRQSFYSYQSRPHSPSAEFNPGRFDSDCMEQIIALWKNLRPKRKSGGRAQLNAIEVRAAIFAVRVNSDWWRLQKHEGRKRQKRTKQMLGIDPENLRAIQTRASRAIRSLERHMKRANSRLLNQTGREPYDALMAAWRAHVRWVRLHLVYFRPLRPIITHSKARYQLILDELQEVAKVAIPEEGYELPADKDLRRMMRLFALSSRRGRRGLFDVPFILNHENDPNGVRLKSQYRRVDSAAPKETTYRTNEPHRSPACGLRPSTYGPHPGSSPRLEEDRPNRARREAARAGEAWMLYPGTRQGTQAIGHKHPQTYDAGGPA